MCKLKFYLPSKSITVIPFTICLLGFPLFQVFILRFSSSLGNSFLPGYSIAYIFKNAFYFTWHMFRVNILLVGKLWVDLFSEVVENKKYLKLF